MVFNSSLYMLLHDVGLRGETIERIFYYIKCPFLICNVLRSYCMHVGLGGETSDRIFYEVRRILDRL